MAHRKAVWFEQPFATYFDRTPLIPPATEPCEDRPQAEVPAAEQSADPYHLGDAAWRHILERRKK